MHRWRVGPTHLFTLLTNVGSLTFGRVELPIGGGARSPDRGLYFEEKTTILPIEGPKNWDEYQQDLEDERKIQEWIARESTRTKIEPPRTQKWLPWTPRPEEDDDIPTEEQGIRVLERPPIVQKNGSRYIRIVIEQLL
jgi:hypothetical protein